MSRTVVIAQARMSSTRLPGKVLMELAGTPVVDRVAARANRAQTVDHVLIATTTDPTDDSLVEHLQSVGINYVRGSLGDVLSRYMLAAEQARADVIVRITCDCPLIDPDAIDAAVSAYRQAPEVDYCGNTLVRTYPIGMDAEVFSRAALERAHSSATAIHEREHVTPYLYQHPELFRLRNVEAPDWAVWPELRLTLDEPADLEMMRELMRVVPPDAGLRDVLGALRAHPEIVARNSDVSHRHVEKPQAW